MNTALIPIDIFKTINNEGYINISLNETIFSNYQQHNDQLTDFNLQSHLNNLINELNGEISTLLRYDDDNIINDIYKKCAKVMMTNISGNNPSFEVWSQAFQDWIIYHNFFYGKTDGIYLDIGAHSPFTFSNTAFFDICMGWKGICVEPSITSIQFAQNRSCNVVKKCVFSITQNNLKMKFKSGGPSSYIIQNQDAYDIDNVFSCDAINGYDLLNQFKPRNKYGKTVSLSVDNVNDTIDIDLISLDIEGSEVEFLKCFPFHKYNVKVWNIEINRISHQLKIDRILINAGYIKYKYLNFYTYRLDAIYIKDDKDFKFPYANSSKWQLYEKCES